MYYVSEQKAKRKQDRVEAEAAAKKAEEEEIARKIKLATLDLITYGELNDQHERDRLAQEAEDARKVQEEEYRRKLVPFDLILVRHGESDGNASQLCQGHTPGRLTPKGRSQAELLGPALFKDPPIRYDEIYCSDLNRVKETCSIAMNKGEYELIDEDKIVYTPLLREKSAGIYEMRPKKFMHQCMKDSKEPNERKFKPRNGESWEDLQLRVVEFVEDIKSSNRPDRKKKTNGEPWRILAFTSGGFIKEFINAHVFGHTWEENEEKNLLWMSARQYYPNKAANGSIYVFKAIPLVEGQFEMVVENYRPGVKIAPKPKPVINTEEELKGLTSKQKLRRQREIKEELEQKEKEEAEALTKDPKEFLNNAYIRRPKLSESEKYDQRLKMKQEIDTKSKAARAARKTRISSPLRPSLGENRKKLEKAIAAAPSPRLLPRQGSPSGRSGKEEASQLAKLLLGSHMVRPSFHGASSDGKGVKTPEKGTR